MAFLREYEFYEDAGVLIEYFYIDHRIEKPSMVITFNIHTRSFFIRNVGYSVTDSLISDEIRRLLDLRLQPHFKSYVKTCSTSHRIKLYDLFATSADF